MIDTSLLNALSTIASTYPSHIPPQNPDECMTYRRISTTGQMLHDGPCGLLTARFQITVHSTIHSRALELAEEVRTLLDGSFTGIDQLIDLVEIDNVYDLGFQPDAERWQIAVDAIVHYRTEN
jgi:hypothetical protein